MLTTLWQDLRYGGRLLVRSPFFRALKERAAEIPGIRSTAEGPRTPRIRHHGVAPCGGRQRDDGRTPLARAIGAGQASSSERRQCWIEIVGGAATTKYIGTSEAPTEFLYLPWRQHVASQGALLVHTEADPVTVLNPLREAVRAAGPDVPVFGTRTMEDFYQARSLGPHTLLLQLVGSMGLMGLVLALVGLYGLVAHAVSRRTREIGIRMAVGATPASVLLMVLRHGTWLALAGLGLGSVGSVGVSGLLNAAFPSVPGIGSGLYALVVPVLLAVTVLAAYLPARRAAHIDPLRAIRVE